MKIVYLLMTLLLVGSVTALTDTFRHIDARYSGGEVIISGQYYTEIVPGTIKAFCIHEDIISLIGMQEYTELSNSADGLVESFYIRGEVPCIKGDTAWIEADTTRSTNTTIHRTSRHADTNTYNPEEPSGVPEFGAIGLVLAVIGTMAILVYMRRD